MPENLKTSTVYEDLLSFILTVNETVLPVCSGDQFL